MKTILFFYFYIWSFSLWASSEVKSETPSTEKNKKSSSTLLPKDLTSEEKLNEDLDRIKSRIFYQYKPFLKESGASSEDQKVIKEKMDHEKRKNLKLVK